MADASPLGEPVHRALFGIMLSCRLRVSEAIALRPGSAEYLFPGRPVRSSSDWLLDQALAYAGLEGRGIHSLIPAHGPDQPD